MESTREKKKQHGVSFPFLRFFDLGQAPLHPYQTAKTPIEIPDLLA